MALLQLLPGRFWPPGHSRASSASNATVAASPVGLWACIVQRLLDLNACTWHNWLIGAPVKRSLVAYDH
jgi:hypothetical protein